MVQTNNTLSQLTNRVLTEAGERAQASISTPTAEKAVNALRDTYIDISSATDWNWTRKTVLADAWDNEKASFEEGFVRLFRVGYVRDDSRIRFLHEQNEEQFYSGTIQAVNYESCRNYYYVSAYGEVSIAYYPTTAEEQNKYQFTISFDPQLPTAAAEYFVLPPRFEPMLVKGATARFVNMQFSDDNRYQIFNRDFETMLRQFVQRERRENTPGPKNIFSNLRRRM